MDDTMHTYFLVICRDRKGEPDYIDSLKEVTEFVEHVSPSALTARKLADQPAHPAEIEIGQAYRMLQMRARYASNNARLHIVKCNIDLEYILEHRENREFLKLLLTAEI